MTVKGTTDLPLNNQLIRVDTYGQALLGKYHIAFPLELPQPYYRVQTNEMPEPLTYTTDGRKMLLHLSSASTPVEIATGFTLLAALLICDDGVMVEDLQGMTYARHDHSMTLELPRDRFGLIGGSRIVFSDNLHGKLTFRSLSSGSSYGWPGEEDHHGRHN